MYVIFSFRYWNIEQISTQTSANVYIHCSNTSRREISKKKKKKNIEGNLLNDVQPQTLF